jgi:hypothetical protein
MSGKPNKGEPFRKRLEQRGPYLFIEYWKEGERPFNWFAEWSHLSVEITDVSVAIVHTYLDKRFGELEPPVALRKSHADEIVIENIPEDQKKPYLEFVNRLFNEEFTKPRTEEVSIIFGKFVIEATRSIGFIRPGETEDGKPTIQRGRILLRGSDDMRPGSLGSISEEDVKWGSPHKPGEVCIELSMAPAQIKAVIAEVRQAASENRPIRAAADLYVLAFQSEVERSLAEPYHPQTYWFRDGAFAPAVLQRLTIWQDSLPPGIERVDDQPRAPPPVPAPPVVGKEGRSMRPLVIALWAIAIAIVIHALR